MSALKYEEIIIDMNVFAKWKNDLKEEIFNFEIFVNMEKIEF